MTRATRFGLLIAATFAWAMPTRAMSADVPVSYKVDSRALKSASVAGNNLTFELYSDSGCTSAVASKVVDIADASILIKQYTLARVKGGSSISKVSQIETVLTGVTVSESLYLKVTGAGIVAVGGDCQVQQSSTPAAAYAARSLECTSTSLTTFGIAANSTNFFNNPACPAGYKATTPYCYTATNGVYSQGSGFNANNPGNQTFCAWQNTTAITQYVYGGNVCCRVPAIP